jgi:hypothetical protein
MTVRTYEAYLGEDTYVLTYDGYRLVGTIEGETLDIWNGIYWQKGMVKKVANVDTMMAVELSDGIRFSCSRNHRMGVMIDDNIVATYARDLSVGMECEPMGKMPIIRNNFYCVVSMDDTNPPIDGNLRMQLGWLAKHLDEGAGCMQITSKDRTWLSKIQLMSHCIGTMPFITRSPRGYHLRWSGNDAAFLIEELHLPIHKKITDYCFVPRHIPRVVSVEALYGDFEVYTIL